MDLLSPRALRLLGGAHRYPVPRNRREIELLLMEKAVPVYEPAIAFQMQYGGLEYSIAGRATATFGILDERHACLADQRGSEWYFSCASYSNMDIDYAIGINGWLFLSRTRPEGASVNLQWDDFPLVSTRVECLFEHDALVSEVCDLSSPWSVHYLFRPFQLPPLSFATTDKVAGSFGLESIECASSNFFRWWGDDRLRLTASGVAAYDPPGAVRMIHVFGRDPRSAAHLFDAARMECDPPRSFCSDQ